MDDLARSLKTLGDPTRLRILRLLSMEALSVGELTAILGLAQPSVSKQLGALKRAGLVREERDGGYAFHKLDEDGGRLWPPVAEELRRAGDTQGDLARLAEVLRRRTDRGGGRRLLEPGRSWPAWARALGYLIPPLEVADLCCGDGALTAEMARWAKRVVAVDRDPKRLQAARRRMAREGFRHIRFKCEEVERLTLPDAAVEMVVLSQALHQFEDTHVPLAQAYRILKPGGRLLLLDLAPHREEWVREKLGHAHLGFPAEELAARVKGAGFAGVRVEDLRKGPAEPFRIVVLTALKGGAEKPAVTKSRRKSPPRTGGTRRRAKKDTGTASALKSRDGKGRSGGKQAGATG